MIKPSHHDSVGPSILQSKHSNPSSVPQSSLPPSTKTTTPIRHEQQCRSATAQQSHCTTAPLRNSHTAQERHHAAEPPRRRATVQLRHRITASPRRNAKKAHQEKAPPRNSVTAPPCKCATVTPNNCANAPRPLPLSTLRRDFSATQHPCPQFGGSFSTIKPSLHL